MKILHLVILGVAIAVVITTFFLYTLSFSELKNKESKNNESCYTRMIVIYAEPAKYNQTVILNALRDNLSNDNFGDYHGPNSWWQSVDISTTDKHVVNLLIPSVDGKTINMTKKIISKIDGVGEIFSSTAECITEDTSH